ncbi:YchJ family metal-binding protein [Kribbella sp. NPDC023972]|uniref:YchJ family protein n=1 Tax=Kribbella sp. NPDC023972 TaxID=3154795 RepID=UPI0033F80131
MPRPSSPCPCGLDASYGECCGRLHDGRAEAATAEQLMRSRYSAFVVGDAAYLLRTWSSATRPAGLQLDRDIEWTGLEILGTADGSPFHTEGMVEFRAGYQVGGRPGHQHERSRFVREDGAWVYVAAL